MTSITASQQVMSLHKILPFIIRTLRGIKNKVKEFTNNLALNPHPVLCLTKHHLVTDQINSVHIQNYNIGAHFCRTKYRNEGVVIYLHESI